MATDLALTRPAPAPPGGALARLRRAWPWLRLAGGAGLLVVLVWRIGPGGLLSGLRQVHPGALAAATGIGVLTTVLSAWRWCLVARGLGIRLPLGSAVADYYRALFLNAVLPGGVLGDVHRAVRHGREIGALGRGVRAVVLERVAGQAVLVAAAAALVLALPTPEGLVTLPAAAGTGAAAAAAVTVAAAAATVALARRRRSAAPRWARAGRAALAEARAGLFGRGVFAGVVVSSVAVLAGYLATFLVAARAAGVSAPAVELLPLLVLALLAMAVPVNVGGFGPREGVCAWAFAAAGLGAAQGFTVAVVYGVSVGAASLPGAGVLLAQGPLRRWTRAAGGSAVPGYPLPPASAPASAPAPAPVPNRSERA